MVVHAIGSTVPLCCLPHHRDNLRGLFAAGLTIAAIGPSLPVLATRMGVDIAALAAYSPRSRLA